MYEETTWQQGRLIVRGTLGRVWLIATPQRVQEWLQTHAVRDAWASHQQAFAAAAELAKAHQ
jgi:hypothetical protein